MSPLTRRKLYEFNNALMAAELLELTAKDAHVPAGERLALAREFVHRHALVDVLYPPKLEGANNLQLLKLEYSVGAAHAQNHGSEGLKRRRPASPVLSAPETDTENSPIWSSDDDE